MDSRMKDDEVGTTRVVKGSMDNVEYYIFNLKEPEYTSKIMSTYGCLAEEGEETSRRINGGTDKKHFRYTQVFNNHFRFRHVVDDHNNFRMMEPCIEKSWRTIKWECRVFSFIIAITEVNAWLAMKYFCGLKLKLLQFRTNLARELIFNPWLQAPSAQSAEDEEVTVLKKRKSGRISMNIQHEFCSAPPYGKNLRQTENGFCPIRIRIKRRFAKVKDAKNKYVPIAHAV